MTANWRATSATVAPTLQKLVAFGELSDHLLWGMSFRLHVIRSSIIYFGGTTHIAGGTDLWGPLTSSQHFKREATR